MVTAVFTDNDDYARAYGLWQWDYGQQLRIEGLHLPTAVEIHFALQETGGEAITRVGTTKDGVTTVTIPDSVLEGNRATWTADKAYNIYAWVYLSDKLSGETIKRITMQVKSRPKPEAFEAPGDGEIFRQAIEAVNDAANRAEDAGDKAIAAADEAKAAATQTAEHLQATEGLAEQVETNADTVAQDKQAVAGMLSQTQQVASDAALSAQEAKLSETAAVQAQTGAEAAEDTARQYAEETEADRQAVANDKQVVSQMREAVAADRQAVERTAAQFGQTAQSAINAVGQAQSTAVGAVKAEGQKQTTAVQEAGTQAVSEVTEAKTTAVQAVTTEGDTQTKRVEDAAAGIVEDREQISQNKTDIAGLVEGMTDLAPAIHSTVSGSIITANDAAEGRPFRGLRVFGRMKQVQTTGAQLIKPIGKFPYKSNGVEAVRNLDGSYTLTGTATTNGNFRIVDPDIENYALNINEVTLSLGVSGGTFDGKCLVSDATKGDWETLLDVTFHKTATGKIQCNKVGMFIVYKAQTTYNVTLYPMLNSGPSALPWEPYTGGKPSPSPEYPQEIVSAGESGTINVSISDSGSQSQSLTLQTPNGLPGVPVSKDGNYTDADGQQWICDEIDLGRGKYVQRVTEKDIYESQNTWGGQGTWGNNDNYNTLGFYSYINGTNGEKNWERLPIYNGMCNYFSLIADAYLKSIIGFTMGDYIAVRVSRSLLPDWDENNPSAEPWTNWLKARKEAGNPVIVRYALKTPIERDLTPEEITAYKALRTYGPTTVVSSDAGVHMEVTYVADTKNYIRNLEQRLSAKLVNIQSALISQKTSGGGVFNNSR